MDAGTVLGFVTAYLATLAGVFLLYFPVLVLLHSPRSILAARRTGGRLEQ